MADQARVMIAHSQLAPLPSESELPFRIISKTIGQGAYAWLGNCSIFGGTPPLTGC